MFSALELETMFTRQYEHLLFLTDERLLNAVSVFLDILTNGDCNEFNCKQRRIKWIKREFKTVQFL